MIRGIRALRHQTLTLQIIQEERRKITPTAA